MSITAVGTIRLNPYPSRGPLDPIGQFIGVGQVVGDATGNEQVVSFDLDESYAYIMRGISVLMSGGIDPQDLTAEYLPGITVDGNTVRYVQSAEIPIIFGQGGFTYIPPRILILPDGNNVAQVRGRAPNVLADILTVSWHALAFDRIAFLTTPPAAFVGFLA